MPRKRQDSVGWSRNLLIFILVAVVFVAYDRFDHWLLATYVAPAAARPQQPHPQNEAMELQPGHTEETLQNNVEPLGATPLPSSPLLAIPDLDAFSYRILEANAVPSDCPGGAVPVEDPETCEAASRVLGKPFLDMHIYTDLDPSGCEFRAIDQDILWNSHSNGRANVGRKPVCRDLLPGESATGPAAKASLSEQRHVDGSQDQVPGRSVPGNLFSTRAVEACHFPEAASRSLVALDNLKSVAANPLESFWAQYQQLHRTARACIEASPEKPTACGRIIIWRCRSGDHCSGLGDQLRGLTAVFYLAMATSRALFVDWSRFGKDVLGFLNPRAVDVTLPTDFSSNIWCKSKIWTGDAGYAVNAIDKVAIDTQFCLEVITSVPPTGIWHNSKLGKETLQKAIPVHYHMLGCCAHFMFDFSPMEAEFLQGQSLPEHFIAVQARMDDGNMGHGHGNPQMNVLGPGLECAAKLGATMFSNGEIWTIFGSASNEVSKKGMLKWTSPELQRLNQRVFVTDTVPVHSDMGNGKDSIPWQETFEGFWVDFFVLTRAAGMVLVGWRSCGFGLSAASLSFLPHDYLLGANCRKFDDFP